MKTISFIIPTLWKSNFIFNLIESLSIWGFGKIYVILNNYQEAGHKLFVDKISQKPVNLIITDKIWVSVARNIWINLVNTDYIYFLDDDISLSENWFWALKTLLESNKVLPCVWWNILVHKTLNNIHKRYWYIYWYKNFWSHNKIIHNNFFWGANIILSTQYIKKIWWFNIQFGHSGQKRLYNEEVLLQKNIIKNWWYLYFESWLSVFHLWVPVLTHQDIVERLINQWKNDAITDKIIDHKLLVLRILKYTIAIFFENIHKYLSHKAYSYDYFRYKSYLQNIQIWLFAK